MSACISSQGEYGSHVPGEGADAFLCQRCYVFDEDGALAEVAGLRTQLAEQETLLRTMDHFADVAETCERKSNAYAAENAVLAGQVAAIRALCDSGRTPIMRAGWLSKADVLAVVASSPTTPGAEG